METKQIVQASANVIRITKVKPGDVYKRFDESYNDRTYYGIVRNVHNDGENSIIEATEYSYQWSGISIEIKIIRGCDDVVMFPSTPEELNVDLSRAKEDKEKDISDNEEKIIKSKKELQEIKDLISGKTLKNLSEMSYKELTQADFNEKKRLVESI